MSKKPHKKNVALIVIGLILGLLVLYFAYSWLSSMAKDNQDALDNRNFIETATSYKWPEGTSDIKIVNDTSDVKSFWISVHIRLPLTVVSGLKDAATSKECSPIDYAFLLPLEKYYARPPLAELKCYQFKTGTQRHTLMLKENTGEIWMVVFRKD